MIDPANSEAIRALLDKWRKHVRDLNARDDAGSRELIQYIGTRVGTFNECADELEAALSAERAWQPIETAPKDGTEILLTDGHWKRTGYWAKRIKVWSVDTAVVLPSPTHWTPLPAPTIETKEQTNDTDTRTGEPEITDRPCFRRVGRESHS